MFCSSCGLQLTSRPPTRCSSCGMHHWNDAKPCGSALVMRGTQLLLVRRAQDPWKGRWDVPGGFCEPGEHPARTAQREVFEETGLRIHIVGFLGIWLDEYRSSDDAAKRTLNIYYHATTADLAAATLDRAEVAEVGFFLPSELPTALAFPAHVPAALEAWKRAMAAGQLFTSLFDCAPSDDRE